MNVAGAFAELTQPVVGSGFHRFAPDCATLPLRYAGRVVWGGEAGGFLRGWLAMNMDSELQKHYAMLLGVGHPWEVKGVELKLAKKIAPVVKETPGQKLCRDLERIRREQQQQRRSGGMHI